MLYPQVRYSCRNIFYNLVRELYHIIYPTVLAYELFRQKWCMTDIFKVESSRKIFSDILLLNNIRKSVCYNTIYIQRFYSMLGDDCKQLRLD
jgi:hypothetical protein